MSYILDALKKLEQEKTRKSRTAGKINIAGELFGSERSQPSEGRRLKTVLLVSAAVLLTFGATWFFLNGDGVQHRVTALSSATRPTPGANIPIPVLVALVPAPPVPQVPVVPLQSAVVPTPAPPLAKSPAQLGAAKTALPDEEGEMHRSRRPLSKKAAASPLHESAVFKPGPAPVDIKVSGIAWQDERSARRAVVNGFLLREGALVSGAKITEILQDRVRFSLSGASFEVTFISAGSPGAGK